MTDIAAEIDAVNTRSTPVERLWSASWVGSSRNDLKSAPGEMAGLDDLPTVSNFEALVFRRDIQLEDSSEECWLADCLGQPARRIRERRIVGRGPARAQPRRLTADLFDVTDALKVGRNTFAVVVTYFGEPNAFWMPAQGSGDLGLGPHLSQNSTWSRQMDN